MADHPEHPQAEDQNPRTARRRVIGGAPGRGPLGGPPDGGLPSGQPGANILESIWRCIVYLKERIQVLEREVYVNKTKTNRSATVAAKAQKELDTAKRDAKELSGMVTQRQRRLDKVEGLGSGGSDGPPVESGSLDNGWGPVLGPGGPRAPEGAHRSLHTPSARGSTCRSKHMAWGHSSGWESDEWLSANHCTRCDLLCILFRPHLGFYDPRYPKCVLKFLKLHFHALTTRGNLERMKKAP